MTGTAKDQDYEIVSPPTDLRSKVRVLSPREAKKFDPVKAAEDAVSRLSPQFSVWMDDETRRLLSAWENIQSKGISQDLLDTLFQSAHNIKGQALTLGFPLVGDVAANFCHLIEAVPSRKELPLELVERYVEAIRAMVMEGAKDEANKTGVELLEKLKAVTDDYLSQFAPGAADA